MLVTIDAFTTIIHDTRRVIYIHELTPKCFGLSVLLKENIRKMLPKFYCLRYFVLKSDANFYEKKK